MAKFFVIPFAQTGDKAPIPEPLQPGGQVSFETGFTVNYELNLITNPAALPVPRDQSNELYYQITNALNQYQTLGFPDFITTADNLGSPFPYDFNAIVRYDDGFNGIRLYKSLVTNNLTLPTDTSKWQLMSFYIAGTATGTANALTLHTTQTYQDLLPGDIVQITASATNTGAATLRVGSGAIIDINVQSTSGFIPLVSGEIVNTGIYNLVYSGSVWLLLNPTNQAQTINYAQLSFQAASTQAIPNGVWTKVFFDNTVIDSNSWWDNVNYRFIPTIAGKYRISALLSGYSPIAATSMLPGVYKNGVLSQCCSQLSYGNGGTGGASFTLTANGTTDFFELFVVTQAGGITIGDALVGYPGVNGTTQNLFEIEYLGI